jgi:dynein heavy chain 1
MDDLPVDMKWVADRESTSRTPILLCSAPGFDPSFKVEQLSKEVGIRLVAVAIGSAEGFE